MIEQLPATELNLWLNDTSRAAPLILDVRERWEYDVCRLPDTRWLPLQEIPARWTELPQNRDIVVVCHHGMRSLQAAQFLARAGLSRLYNLSGGINAWADHVDPAMARY